MASTAAWPPPSPPPTTICVFLHLNYRQRTQEHELQAFNAIADHYRVNHRLVVDAGYMRDIGGSSLTDPHLPIPQEHGDDVPSTYVPFATPIKRASPGPRP